MMRKLLKNKTRTHQGREEYTADFSAVGVRGSRGIVNPTICFKNIRDEDNNLIAKHMWFNYSTEFRKLGELCEGDRISLTAKPSAYHKGHGYLKEDYKLINPRDIRLLNDRPLIPLPMNKKLLIGYVCIKRHMSLSDEHEEEKLYMEWAKAKYIELTCF